MTARYSIAERAAAKRLKMTNALGSVPFSETWLADFRKVYVRGAREDAGFYRSKAREAAKKAAQFDEVAELALIVARAVAREQRKAARS